MNILLRAASLLLLFFAQNLQAQTAKTLEFKNGLWYNGKDFSPGTWYSQNGLLTQKTPVKIDSVVDLENRWVTPPLADAHVSCLTNNPSAKDLVAQYMTEGIFYLQILSNTQEDRKTLDPVLGKTSSPDAVFANGGLTCTLGHPFLKFEPRAHDIKNPEIIRQRMDFIREQRKMLADGYWFVDKKDDLNKNWEKFMAQRPKAVSIYLLDVENSGGKEGKGLTKDMAKAIVKKAQKADLQVIAHVETVADVQLGIKLGVNGFANLPGHNWNGEGDPKQFELGNDDLKKLAKKKIFVTPVFSHAQSAAVSNPLILAFQKKQLQRLFGAGVAVAAGSDDPSRTLRTEINYWLQMGSDLKTETMLSTLVETTPRAIFPERKIGKIAEGHEASFIVLSDNPLNNIMKLRLISFKVKNGVLLK